MTAAHVLNYGNGTYTLPEDTHDLGAEQKQLTSWLEEFLAKPKIDLPRPPSVVLEIMEASRKPMAKIEDLAALLEREPLLSGRVLRLANSALYASSSPCVTLKQALIRMGLALVRDVVMEAAMQMTVIHAEGFNATLESIRKHSSAVAWISRFVARNTPIQGGSADIIKLAMLHVAKELAKGKKDAVLLLQVHDELVFECEKGEAPAFGAWVKKVMEAAIKLRVPVVAEVKVGANWQDMEKQ